MTHFYAMLANGGQLVRPHLLQQVEQPGSRRTGAARPAPLLGAAAAREQASTRRRCRSSRRGSFDATHGNLRHASAVFSSFPTAIAGKTGTAEKVVPEINAYKRHATSRGSAGTARR